MVTNTPGANSVAVAEMALCAMLALSRNVVEGDRRVRSGQWGTITGAELSRKKVGIVGFGAIGRCLSRLLRGFACEIYAYDPYADKEAAGELGVSLVSLDELLTHRTMYPARSKHAGNKEHVLRGDLCQDEEDRLPH